MKLRYLIIPAIVVLLALFASCVPAGTDANIPATINSQVSTRVLATAQAIPTFTPLPTYTPYPTQTPAPTPEPVIEVATATIPALTEVFLELQGAGPLVTQNFEWGDCRKAIFYWTAADGERIDVRLHRLGDPALSAKLVDEVDLEAGEALQILEAGTYFLEFKRGPHAGWSIIGECQP